MFPSTAQTASRRPQTHEQWRVAAVFLRAPLRALLQSTVLLLICASARAQVTAVAGGNPNHIDLAIPVRASVASRCGFAEGAGPQGSYTAPDITAGFTHNFFFSLQCNGPSRVAVESANGGLLAEADTPPAGYTLLAPYQVMLYLVGDAGVPAASSFCDAVTLQANAVNPCGFRGPSSGTHGLALQGASHNAQGSYLRVSAPAYAGSNRLIASNTYADTLSVTLSAAL